MLTIQILTKNNESTIDSTLQSLLPLKSKVLVGDLGSTDQTINICKKYNVEIFSLDPQKHYCELRNNLTSDQWNLYLEPWEILVDPMFRVEKGKYYLRIFTGDMIIKEVRLWYGKTEFQNPVFAMIPETGAKFLDKTLIYAKPHSSDSWNKLEIWEKSTPTSPWPHYYRAGLYLSQEKFEEFLKESQYYLFKERGNNIQKIMMYYHISMVNFYIIKDIQKSLQHLSLCLAEKPLMAEFWCLLGDIYCNLRKYVESIVFYENAIILGSKRLQSDFWPIDIKKYKEYPMNMIKKLNRSRLSLP